MTIKDIARLSGYGVGTVSRVLNKHPDVSEKAREHILEVIEEYNYQPNTNAKLLKMRSTSSLALIVKGSHHMFFADLVEQVQNLLLKNKEDVVVNYIDEDDNEVLYAQALCRDRNPKGIIFLGANLEYFEKDFGEISVPCVLLTNNASHLTFDNLSSVSTDDEAASYEVIDYLVQKGHTNIGILGGNLTGVQIGGARLSGAIQSFQAHGLTFDQHLQYVPCRFSMEEGYAAAKELIEHNPGLTAIFALSDIIAVGAMRAIQDMGKHIANDISIVGYDGILLSRYSIPRLTTIQQNIEQIARTGVDLMLQRIHYPYEPVHVTVPYELLEQESVQDLR